ncbi:MAG: hypothetical protein ABEJ28_07940 [Salinigranum sp.]
MDDGPPALGDARSSERTHPVSQSLDDSPSRGLDDSPSPDLDDLLDLCSDRRRRELLALLAGADEPRSVSALVDELVSSDAVASGDAFAADERPAVTASLVHVHLPKLAAAGVLEFDRECRTVARGAHFRRTVSLLEALAG